MAHIIMRPPLRLARSHGQQRLRAIQCLDLGLFVHAQNQRFFRRIRILVSGSLSFATRRAARQSSRR